MHLRFLWHSRFIHASLSLSNKGHWSMLQYMNRAANNQEIETLSDKKAKSQVMCSWCLFLKELFGVWALP